MREIRPSGSEGGVADNGHPYPYLGGHRTRCLIGLHPGFLLQTLPYLSIS